jgi:DNA polymerase-3 subunit epsilon
VRDVADALRAAWAEGLPVVAYNASYDLTLLSAELTRFGLAPLALGPIVDPWVLDRHCDPGRQESRRLALVCRRHGVLLEDPHQAHADALAAAQLACRLPERFPSIAKMGLLDLDACQAA